MLCGLRPAQSVCSLTSSSAAEYKRPTATVDRLMHHAHLCQTSGKSVRLSEASSGRGVVPLGPKEPLA